MVLMFWKPHITLLKAHLAVRENLIRTGMYVLPRGELSRHYDVLSWTENIGIFIS